MLNYFRNILLVFMISVLLVSCGWHPRGEGGSALASIKGTTFYINKNNFNEFANRVTKVINNYDAIIVDDYKKADYVINIQNAQRGQQLISIIGGGSNNAYNLTYTVTYNVVVPDVKKIEASEKAEQEAAEKVKNEESTDSANSDKTDNPMKNIKKSDDNDIAINCPNGMCDVKEDESSGVDAKGKYVQEVIPEKTLKTQQYWQSNAGMQLAQDSEATRVYNNIEDQLAMNMVNQIALLLPSKPQNQSKSATNSKSYITSATSK